MKEALKPVVSEALEKGWWVAQDLGESVVLRKYRNSYEIGSRPLITTISLKDGEVIQSKIKVVDQGGNKYKYMALAAIVLFILLLIFVA